MIQGGDDSGLFAPCDDDGDGFGSGCDISLFGNGFGAGSADGSHFCCSRFSN